MSSVSKGASSDTKDLIAKMLSKKETERYDIKQVLAHRALAPFADTWDQPLTKAEVELLKKAHSLNVKYDRTREEPEDVLRYSRHSVDPTDSSSIPLGEVNQNNQIYLKKQAIKSGFKGGQTATAVPAQGPQKQSAPMVLRREPNSFQSDHPVRKEAVQQGLSSITLNRQELMGAYINNSKANNIASSTFVNAIQTANGAPKVPQTGVVSTYNLHSSNSLQTANSHHFLAPSKSSEPSNVKRHQIFVNSSGLQTKQPATSNANNVPTSTSLERNYVNSASRDNAVYGGLSDSKYSSSLASKPTQTYTKTYQPMSESKVQMVKFLNNQIEKKEEHPKVNVNYLLESNVEYGNATIARPGNNIFNSGYQQPTNVQRIQTQPNIVTKEAVSSTGITYRVSRQLTEGTFSHQSLKDNQVPRAHENHLLHPYEPLKIAKPTAEIQTNVKQQKAYQTPVPSQKVTTVNNGPRIYSMHNNPPLPSGPSPSTRVFRSPQPMSSAYSNAQTTQYRPMQPPTTYATSQPKTDFRTAIFKAESTSRNFGTSSYQNQSIAAQVTSTQKRVANATSGTYTYRVR